MDILATLNNRQIQTGDNLTPDVGIPQQYTFFQAHLSRDNWPAAGVYFEVQVTYDGVAWVRAVSADIAPFVATPKQPTVTDAVIGFGWADDRKPIRVRVRTVSPSQFMADVLVEAQ